MTSSDEKIWRVIDVLNWSKNYLTEKGIESPQVEAEWILRDVLNCSRIDIYLYYERPLEPAELARCRSCLRQRAVGRPIQYILGYTEFMGLRFEVTPEVLIPRQDTESVVERIIEMMQKMNPNDFQILDIGTGSGNIIVSLLHQFPNARGVGVDISAEALKVARRNAVYHNVDRRIEFLRLDILKELPAATRKFDCIVSNPPYIAGQWLEDLSPLVKENEPFAALSPGGDGLIFYRRFAEAGPGLLAKDGILVLEIGGTYQEEPVTSILTAAGFGDFEVIHDYLPQSRGIVARLV